MLTIYYEIYMYPKKYTVYIFKYSLEINKMNSIVLTLLKKNTRILEFNHLHALLQLHPPLFPLELSIISINHTYAVF